MNIEATHPKKYLVQCIRCQHYGNSRTYCQHTPRCVKYEDIHNSDEFHKDDSTLTTCTLCKGTHLTFYKEHLKFKFY